MTIEERAAQRYELHDWMSKSTRDAVKLARKVFIEIASEQDHIARAEERKRCIDIAKEHICGRCRYSAPELGACLQYNKIEKCYAIIQLCKAMKGE